MTTVLVCGGRAYDDWQRVRDTLDPMGITKLVHGGAPGADRLADNWAYYKHVPVKAYRAEWHIYGSAAGPVRNQKMLDSEKIDTVVAFPGGRGTADMVRRARAANIPVIEVK